MDPVAMVEHLDDPLALAAARAIEARTYLVYIEEELELPFPGKPWYQFCVCPIGTSLRLADPENRITSDMCIPIHPNERHPGGRPGVVTEPEFPYDNCYHWIDFRIYVRVRARPEGFEGGNAIRLPPRQQGRMHRLWDEDRRRAVSKDTDDASARSESDQSSMHSESYSDPSADEASIDSADGALMQMNIFGDDSHDLELFPLVDLWHELAEHIQQGEIPNPMEIFKERDRVVEIIQQARSRANAVLNAPLPTEENVAERIEIASLSTPGMENTHKTTFWRGIRGRGRRILRRMWRVVALPYIPIWP
ncbi:hypothetical protein ONZ51_g349 [Trametes cubensis]|uniref:Uncharacterized protein n=1 Tax=Trametes cubensis TaxID=1111947 RepID=A0AAD7U3F1_9APHY|nr:hypothetical protein ONZ51_g349 [Trametes cubensis]